MAATVWGRAGWCRYTVPSPPAGGPLALPATPGVTAHWAELCPHKVVSKP